MVRKGNVRVTNTIAVTKGTSRTCLLTATKSENEMPCRAYHTPRTDTTTPIRPGRPSRRELVGFVDSKFDQIEYFFDQPGHTSIFVARRNGDVDLSSQAKGVLQSAYTGLLRILDTATGSDARQENKNLLLSEGARADSIGNRSSGQVTLHRLLRDHLQGKLFRLLLDNGTAGSGFNSFGLSDDPDPTGANGDEDNGNGRMTLVDRARRDATSEERRGEIVTLK